MDSVYSLNEQSRTLKTLLLTDLVKSLVEPHGAFYLAMRPIKKVQRRPLLLIGKVVLFPTTYLTAREKS